MIGVFYGRHTYSTLTDSSGSHIYQEGLVSFSVVAAMLRLGHKYGFDGLCSEAKRRLLGDFPSKLEDMWKGWKYINADCDGDSGCYSGLAFDVAKILQETGFLAPLPCVLYVLCDGQIDVAQTDILHGAKRRDGTTAFIPPEYQDICIAACFSLLHAQTDYTLAWLDNAGAPSCISPRQCQSSRCEIKINIWSPIPLIVGLDDWDDSWELGLCVACIALAKACHEEGRREIWDRLPSFFGLPPWEELEKER